MEQPGQSDATGWNAPLVSVVIATHNRPAALRQALKSVLAQTLQDFEILVIGDACRPDTAAVVGEFGDPRILYVDLPVNFGEQSGPNNIGFARARGRFVALLNHDDLWFPDHLAATTGWIDATNADVVIARGVVVEPPVDGKPVKNSIFGIGKDGFYDPASTTGFGSAQIVRRASLNRLGPWRPASQCFCESSQDWLFRAWRKGALISTMPHLTVLKLHSGTRKGSYVGDTATEQEELLDAMHMPDALRATVLATAEAPRSSRYTYLRRRVLAACGIHPRARSFRHKHGRGAFVARLREIRGLAPMPEREPGVDEMLMFYRDRKDAAAKDS
ncbi:MULTISPECIES: glycosyltransferase family 2 protein [Mesorhizobium]|uniref:Glycosyl transferase family 2 n=1 Tax=Mesorhizobium opportunistum (strain LMG 24607 / HAMBI 3007 / WSM2075) TaxID=536019 RepID=F7Y045_MESOW|nr:MULTISPECIES: glycosyltransferase family 2 protein [Mesorhizobium]AEH89335.1 glycosyl transferase family 2 [Mesorhizobium opportunistum WSM2075]MCA0034706.1 glycosyltransferase [Mesorhizobium sp. B263B2A]